MIKLKNVAKTYDDGKTFVVKDVSLTVNKGETLVLLGSSGSGKSTTLKLINRLTELSAGDIEINGQDIKSFDPISLRRSIGYVFQGIGLFPHMTIAENVAAVLRILNYSIAERRDQAYQLLNLVNLDPAKFADRFPHELSGGQQQRVGVARALAADPHFLLMDEPFGALDAITRDDLQAEVLRLNQELRKTIVFVTHDIFEAIRLGDRIAVLHQGQLQQIGTSHDILANPATQFVEDLFAKSKMQCANLIEQEK